MYYRHRVEIKDDRVPGRTEPEYACVLEGKVDAVIMTGGVSNDEEFIAGIEKYCGWIAPVYSYPGEVEHEAMAAGALRVLRGEEEPQEYTLIISAHNSYIFPKEAIEKKGGKFIGGWGCPGKAVFFPLNIFGGVNKVRPNEEDIKTGSEYLKKLLEENP